MTPETGTLVAAGGLLVEAAVLTWLFWKLPEWTRPELFFAVTVEADYRERPEGREILGRYRRGVVVAFLLTASLAVASAWAPAVLPLAVLAQLAGFFWAFLAARRRVLPAAVEPTAVREALVGRERERLPGGWAAQLGPFGLLAAVGVYLAGRWEEIPARFPTHFDLAGRPDAWSDRSVAAVFGPLLIGLSLCGLVALMAYGVLNWSRAVHVAGEAARTERERRRAVVGVAIGANYLVAIVLTLVALLPLARSPQEVQEVLVVLRIVAYAGGAALLIWLVARLAPKLAARRRPEEASPVPPPTGDRSADRHWKLGMIYYNPDDPALFLERRFGIGYTLNMGRPAAWAILLASLLVPLGMILLVTALS